MRHRWAYAPKYHFRRAGANNYDTHHGEGPASVEYSKHYMQSPFRCFFVFGWVMGLYFILIWPSFHWLTPIMNYPGQIHIHGIVSLFVGSFVAGFMLTALPRFTQTPAPRATFVYGALGISVMEFISLLFISIAWGAVFGAVKFLILLLFVVARARLNPKLFTPNLFWLISALFCGILACSVEMLEWWSHIENFPLDSFRILFPRGFAVPLVLGIGSRLFPMLAEFNTFSRRLKRSLRTEILLGLAYYGGIAIEIWFSNLARFGLALQCCTVVWMTFISWGIWRAPGRSARAWGVWLSTQLLVAGYIFALSYPEHQVDFLHLSYAGGILGLILMISGHVVVHHESLSPGLLSRFFPLGFVLLLVTSTAVLRAITHSSQEKYYLNLGIAGILAGVAFAVWGAGFIGPLFLSLRKSNPE